ncbi:hypothetical protein MAA8898_01443 [Maliponia aquimaris]|uniref:Urea ABC transporter, urea binding protein n=1 Tax=Maliponia aquimaris TaxID=1673631 RepID=A0A238K6Z3_9RHOB|nr:hypothetical protein MAA8898_01443 [Maliponia aquimaris]
MNRVTKLLSGAAALAIIASGASAQDCPIKVGVLHSLSGTMAISDTTLENPMLMQVVDPASDWPPFAE